MPEKKTAASLAKRLRESGLRLTPQRLAIYEELVSRDDHPTAQRLHLDLAQRFPSLSPATVYNTLEVLVERGLVHELGEAGDSAIHYDGDVEPHLNLVCTRCHRIDDLHDPALAGLYDGLAEQSGYQIRGARLVFYGLCPACQEAQS
ncbi:MAG: transcriptional repressor [Chloroflexi bacterium]|nr:transcriptional repressor [Chloroflexota bacterium]